MLFNFDTQVRQSRLLVLQTTKYNRVLGFEFTRNVFVQFDLDSQIRAYLEMTELLS